MQFEFTSQLWVYNGDAAWYFVTLPTELADEIKFYQEKRVGFGTVRVNVLIGKTQWQTSLFPDKASSSYLLPIKLAIRKKENINIGDMVDIILNIDV